jgi:hypothetical protein
MMKRLCLAGLAILLLQGCASHVYNVPSERAAPVIDNPIEGTILAKKDQGKDRILRASGIVRETRGRMVHLAGFNFAAKCGTPFLGSAMMLGLVPAEVSEYAHVEISTWVLGGKKVRTTYLVEVNNRYSLWERFAFWHDDEQAMARALGWAYKENRVVR